MSPYLNSEVCLSSIQLGPTRSDPEIHGADGLGGAEGLYERDHAGVQARLQGIEGRKAVIGMAKAVSETLVGGSSGKVSGLSSCSITRIDRPFHEGDADCDGTIDQHRFVLQPLSGAYGIFG